MKVKIESDSFDNHYKILKKRMTQCKPIYLKIGNTNILLHLTNHSMDILSYTGIEKIEATSIIGAK